MVYLRLHGWHAGLRACTVAESALWLGLPLLLLLEKELLLQLLSHRMHMLLLLLLLLLLQLYMFG
jgi:hypothetical protein